MAVSGSPGPDRPRPTGRQKGSKDAEVAAVAAAARGAVEGEGTPGPWGEEDGGRATGKGRGGGVGGGGGVGQAMPRGVWL